jgi:hypothetical protein
MTCSTSYIAGIVASVHDVCKEQVPVQKGRVHHASKDLWYVGETVDGRVRWMDGWTRSTSNSSLSIHTTNMEGAASFLLWLILLLAVAAIAYYYLCDDDCSRSRSRKHHSRNNCHESRSRDHCDYSRPHHSRPRNCH